MSAIDLRTLWMELNVPDEAIQALSGGELIVLTSRHGNGGRGRSVLCAIAALVTDRTVVQMAMHGCGVVSISVDQQTAFQLGLRRMSGSRSRVPEGGEYLVSIEAALCTGTGISARDRATTLRAAGAVGATHDDLVMPGHVMPFLVHGRISSSSDLPEFAHATAIRATGYAVPVWCDVLSCEGEVADLEQSLALAQRLGLFAMVAEDCLVPSPHVQRLAHPLAISSGCIA